jgi:hypothetical protein
MFCPNCGTKNNVGLNYCRSCGLKLDAIVEAVADQMPASEDAESQRRREKSGQPSRVALSIHVVIGLALIVFFVTQYEALGYFFGSVLFGTIVAWIWFLLGIILYPKFIKKDGRNYPPQVEAVPASTGVTTRLIEDRPFEAAPSSVTENTTDLLKVPSADRKD